MLGLRAVGLPDILDAREVGRAARPGTDLLTGQRASQDILNPENGEVIVRKGRKFTKGVVKRMRTADLRRLPLEGEDLVGKVSAEEAKAAARSGVIRGSR